MKYNFVVSDINELHINTKNYIFFSDPYLYYRFRQNNEGFHNIKVADFNIRNKNDLICNHEFIELKFDKYIELLSARLNKYHKSDFSKIFWERALSISFLRYITYVHEMYLTCINNFDINNHICNILDDNSYLIPIDFEENRKLFQHSSLGQEQLFSIYINLFHPGKFRSVNLNFKNPRKVNSARTTKFSSKFIRNFNLLVFDKLILRFFKILFKFRSRRTVSIGSFFSPKMLNKLIFKSFGKFMPLELDLSLADNTKIDFLGRRDLSEFTHQFDDFDRYFFSTLPYCLPKLYLENFNYFIDKFSSIKFEFKFITSEAWLSDSYLSIFLSYIKEKYKISLIYNEHNYFEHPWEGSLVNRESKLCDVYLSLGWSSSKLHNIVPASSLALNFQQKRKRKIKYKIIYIASGAASKRPNYSSSYGWCSENAPKYFSFISSFFSSLSFEIKSNIVYRYYPIINSEELLLYDQDNMIESDLLLMNKNCDLNTPALELMRQSQLVIVDYLSTSYLESLIMNVPTIFFWNKNSYILSREFEDFFKELIDAKICHTDPQEAASHVSLIFDNPSEWWFSCNVQSARKSFLKTNFGEASNMINYLIKL